MVLFRHGTVVLHVVQLFHRRLHGGGVREVREGVAFGCLGVLQGPIRRRRMPISEILWDVTIIENANVSCLQTLLLSLPKP